MDRLAGGDRDQRGARLHQVIVARAEDVERAEQIDVDHRLEGVGRELHRRREEVAGRARDQHVDRAELARRLGISGLETGIIAHVAGDADRFGAGFADAGGGSLDLVSAAAEHRYLGAFRGETVGDGEVDPARCPRDEDVLARIPTGHDPLPFLTITSVTAAMP